VKIDPLNGVAESNEGNNKWMKTAPDACFKP
jgi:subtilase family serine protease